MWRRNWSRGIKIVIIVVVSCIIWLHLALPSLPNDPSGSPESLEFEPSLPFHRAAHKFLKAIKYEENTQKNLTYEEIAEIREYILVHSENETILNEELFGPLQQDSIVIVIQIMQIFYPHSLQTHPYSYPGQSVGDCTRNTSPKYASSGRCVGSPDIYGHFREPRFTQTKLHWWWKANKVFDNVPALRNHSGLVLFLEEDHYVTEDFLHVLLLLNKLMPKICQKCSVITLGNYLKNYNFAKDSKKIEIATWISSKHNMGFAFNHSLWDKIQKCAQPFCDHDDYNWDWSLQHISGTCLPQRIFTLVARAPRVFHIGECGVHHKKTDCSSRALLNKVYRTIASSQHALFPRQIVIITAPIRKFKKHKGNGGWGDKRDHDLCKSFSLSTAPVNPYVESLIQDPLKYVPSNKNISSRKSVKVVVL